MRIFVINGRKCIQFFMVFAIVLGLLVTNITVTNIFGKKSQNAFSTKRELPIYSVEYTEIANHGYSHLRMSQVDKARVRSEI